MRLNKIGDKVWYHSGIRQGVIHQGSSEQLTALIVDDFFVKRLADTLRKSAVDLGFDKIVIEYAPTVIYRHIFEHLYLAGIGVYLDYGKVSARRVSCAGWAKIAPGGQAFNRCSIGGVRRLPLNKIRLLLDHAGKLTYFNRPCRGSSYRHPAVLHDKICRRHFQELGSKLQSFFFDGF